MVSCSKYGAGQLREVCQFLREARTSDGAGGWVSTWAPIIGAPSRCMFSRVSGSERWQAMRVDATVRARIVCRWSSAFETASGLFVRGRLLWAPGVFAFADVGKTIRFATARAETINPGDRIVIKGRAYNIRFIGAEGIAPKWAVIDVDGGVAT